MKTRDLLAIAFILFAVILGAAMRLSDSIPNFAPIGAIALFSGAIISRRWLAFVLPLGALLLSDVIIELNTAGAGFHNTMFFVYGAYAAAVLIGIGITRLNNRNVPSTKPDTVDSVSPVKNGLNPAYIAGGALGASLLFFIISNFGVWLVSGMYAWNIGGLITCYEMAIPFYRTTLISDLVYSGVFFGGFYLITSRIPALAKVKA